MSSSSVEPDSPLQPIAELTEDFDLRLAKGFVKELVRRIEAAGPTMTASELELVRKVLSDNSISFATIKRGDFGEVAKQAAEAFPFDAGGNVVSMQGSH